MQRDSNWFQMRLGKITASEVHKIMGARGLGKTGETYIFDKVAEILTGEVAYIPENTAMQWGIDHEPIAKEYYQKAFKENIKDIDFLKSSKFPNDVGASPDGIVENVRGLEIKCPYNSSNHAKYMTLESPEHLLKMEPKYYWQIQLNLFCSDLDFWRFISFDPRFKGKQRMFILDIPKEAVKMAEIESRLIEAINLKEKVLTTINNL
jgi:putative phage-type endonuclease